MEFRYRVKKKSETTESKQDDHDISTNDNRDTADDTHHSENENGNITNHCQELNMTTTTTRSRNAKWLKDRNSIILLLFLYLLQGVPLGMASSMPLIIQTIGVSWSQQAIFSFAFWPFSLKLLWAPVVDAIYKKRFGRRKSWLIPTQYMIGFVMIVLSFYINDIVKTNKESSNSKPNIYFLTSIFFGLSFLAATQDICVDGWALSMLSRENVGWASTCNSVGQTAGFFLGNVVFLALESKDFANRYIRYPLKLEEQSTGLITLPGFLLFWGIIFSISTTLVALLKHEIDESYDLNEPHFGLTETYKVLIKVLRLPSVRSFAILLLTAKIGFGAIDAMTGLELIERGVAKESLALLAIPLTPLQILLPFGISRFTTGKKPLNIYVASYPFRIFFGLIMAVFVYFTPWFQKGEKIFPWYFYALAVIIYGIHQVFVYNMYVSIMAFFAQISDPKIGGTYMTLLNTFANLGGNWVSTTVLYAADYLSWNKCSTTGNFCHMWFREKSCRDSGGTCKIFIDSYYIETVICTIVGIIWLWASYRTLMRLQNAPVTTWQVRRNHRKTKLLDEYDEDRSSDAIA